LLERFSDQKLVLSIRAIAPENILRFCEGGDFMDPIEYRLIGRPCATDPTRREYGWRDIFHGTKNVHLNHESAFAKAPA
jgi:hypothetical protein